MRNGIENDFLKLRSKQPQVRRKQEGIYHLNKITSWEEGHVPSGFPCYASKLAQLPLTPL